MTSRSPLARTMAPTPEQATLEESTSHWPEYLMEAFGLGAFMVSACLFDALLEHPASPVHRAIPSDLSRRAVMGIAMGSTAISIIYSPWGKQSGAHINPAVTLAFWRLGRVRARDALGYIVSQHAGAVSGVALSYALLGPILADPAVAFAVTTPGSGGIIVAFIAEVAISALLMRTVLLVSASRLSRYTGLAAGTLVALFIILEAPLSGMSMNPARTFGSAVIANSWRAIWLYYLAPPLGMILATIASARSAGCAKLDHAPTRRCIHCGYSP